jgi:hypothetical protein
MTAMDQVEEAFGAVQSFDVRDLRKLNGSSSGKV